MKKHLVALLLLPWLFLNNVQAGYDANITGVVTEIHTYQSGLILFRTSTQPTSHPQCGPVYFAISTDIDTFAADRMYARLLLHYKAQSSAVIGYDSQGDCSGGYIRTHRVGG